MSNVPQSFSDRPRHPPAEFESRRKSRSDPVRDRGVEAKFFASHQETRAHGDVSFPGMLIKRILCGEDAILNNVDQSEPRPGRLGGVAGADEGETRAAHHYYAPQHKLPLYYAAL